MQKIFVPVVCLLLLAAAWRSYGWQGVALVGGGLMMWVLLHYTRLVNVLPAHGSEVATNELGPPDPLQPSQATVVGTRICAVLPLNASSRLISML